MKIRTDYVTNSSSASFIIATNLEAKDLLTKIYDSDMKLEDKYVIKEFLGDKSKLLPVREMSSSVVRSLNVLTPLDEDAYDYIEMTWLDEGTGNIRYKHIFVYKVYQLEHGWTEFYALLDAFRDDKSIYVEDFHWD